MTSISGLPEPTLAQLQLWMNELRAILGGGGPDLTPEGEAAIAARGIAVRRSREPGLFLLNYDQINSREDDPLTRVCRGLVMSEAGLRVEAMGHVRFFNLGSGHADPINWSRAVVEEKADGSLMLITPRAGGVLIGTRGVLDGRNATRRLTGDGGTSVRSFRQAVLDTAQAIGARLPEADEDGRVMGPDGVRRRVTLITELTSPENQVIVVHRQAGLTLHGVRDLDTLEELDVAAWSAHTGLPAITVHALRDEAAVRAHLAELSFMDSEGVIIREDRGGYSLRVKAKSEQYVRASLLAGSLNAVRLLEALLAGERSEIEATLGEQVLAATHRAQLLLDAISARASALAREALEASAGEQDPRARRKLMAPLIARQVIGGLVFGMLDHPDLSALQLLSRQLPPARERMYRSFTEEFTRIERSLGLTEVEAQAAEAQALKS